MEKTVTMHLRVDPTAKRQAEVVLKHLGIPMSTAVNMYLRQIGMKGGIPFAVTTDAPPAEINADAMTDAQLHAAIAEGIDDMRHGRTTDAHTVFANFRDAHQ